MAEVATLSTQQATTTGILAPTTSNTVRPTSISEAQALIANREARRKVAQDEWLAAIDAVEKWTNLSETASSDSLRISAEAQAERYNANAAILSAELDKIDGEIAFFKQELERLRAATGLPTTTTAASTAAAQAAAAAAAKAAAEAAAKAAAAAKGGTVVASGLPFGLTNQQALFLIGIPLLVGVVMALSGSEG